VLLKTKMHATAAWFPSSFYLPSLSLRRRPTQPYNDKRIFDFLLAAAWLSSAASSRLISSSCRAVKQRTPDPCRTDKLPQINLSVLHK
jgi:hypothetical protein